MQPPLLSLPFHLVLFGVSLGGLSHHSPTIILCCWSIMFCTQKPCLFQLGCPSSAGNLEGDHNSPWLWPKKEEPSLQWPRHGTGGTIQHIVTWCVCLLFLHRMAPLPCLDAIRVRANHNLGAPEDRANWLPFLCLIPEHLILGRRENDSLESFTLNCLLQFGVDMLFMLLT